MFRYISIKTVIIITENYNTAIPPLIFNCSNAGHDCAGSLMLDEKYCILLIDEMLSNSGNVKCMQYIYEIKCLKLLTYHQNFTLYSIRRRAEIRRRGDDN